MVNDSYMATPGRRFSMSGPRDDIVANYEPRWLLFWQEVQFGQSRVALLNPNKMK
jgi:hypothetical protein